MRYLMLTAISHPDAGMSRYRMISDDAIERLYRAEASKLIGFARKKGADPNDAEEIVQEAFFKLARYGGGDKIRNDIAFLRTIIVNLIRDKFRVKGKRPKHVDYDELAYEPQSEEPEPETAVHARQELSQTLQDIENLPDITRKVFVAYRLENHTYDQIAHDLDLTIALVRRHLRDALVQLTLQRGRREH